jgi:hypothetical protein
MKPALALREDPMNEAFAEADDGAAGPESPEAVQERWLLEELKRGSREAAERLVEATYARVYGSLVRLTGDADQAADLTQETYRKAWQSLGGFREASQVSTWLYKHRLQHLPQLASAAVPHRAARAGGRGDRGR